MAASYYQRTSGKLALCLVTTGAGSTNAITGVMAAYMDHVPLLVISGNEPSKYMEKPERVWGVQGYDSAGMARNCAKQTYRIKKNPIATLEDAMRVALAAPGGPVWVDIPKDVQSAN
jgi:acetolactate synthase-1/2/3 large subunit